MAEAEEVRARTLSLVDDYLLLLAAQRWDEWIDLWADDGELVFPYSPPQRPGTFRGKDEILAYMKAASGRMAVDALEHHQVHPMLDPAVAVVEFAVKGRLLSTGRPYDQRYVLFFETEDGRLRRYREYWDPLVLADAYGSVEAWVAAST